MSTTEREFIKNRSFEVASLPEWATTAERIAFLLEGSRVVLLGDDRTDIELEIDADDIALGSRLYATDGESLEAYGLSGTRVWSLAIEEPRRIVAPDDEDLVVVQTGDARYVGYDGATSREHFSVDRPHVNVTDNPGLVCGDSGLVISAWSFLTVLDYDGELLLETTVDGAIDAHAVLDDVVLCATRDDRFLGVSMADGEQRWKHDWAVDGLGRHAHEEYLLRGEDELRACRPDGSYRVVDLGRGLPITAGHGEPICLHRDGIVSVFRSGDRSIEDVVADLGNETITSQDQFVVFELTNHGERGTVLDLELEAEGLETPEATRPVTIAPGANERIRFQIGEIIDTVANLRLLADGEDLFECEVEVEHTSGELTCTTHVAEITPDGSTVSVIVSNDNPTPVEGLEVQPMELVVPPIDAGAEETVEVRCDPATELSVAGGDTMIDLGIPVPEEPIDAAVRGTDEGLEVTVRNMTDARITGAVTLSSDVLPGDIEREIDLLAKGSMVIIFPVTSTGKTTVHLGGDYLATEERVVIPADAHRIQTEPSTTEPAEEDPTQDEAAENRPEPSPDREQATSTPHEPETGPALVASPELETVRADREVTPNATTIGQAVTEDITLGNLGSDTIDVRMEAADIEEERTVSIDSGEQVTLSRLHVPFTEDVSVPAVAIYLGDAVHRLGRYDLEMEEADFDVRCIMLGDEIGAGGYVNMALEAPESTVRVRGLSSSVATLESDALPLTVEPGTTEHLNTVIRERTAASNAPLPIEVEFQSRGGNSGTYTTLAYPVPEADLGFKTLELSVSDKSSFGDADGTVAVELENEGVPIEDLVVEADGEQLRDILYDRDEVGRLESNERHTHLIDVATADEPFDIDIDLTGTIADSEVTATATLSGIPPNTDDLSVELHGSEQFDPIGFDYPSRVSTPFF